LLSGRRVGRRRYERVRERRVVSKVQRIENLIADSTNQRAESRDQRAESREQRAESRREQDRTPDSVEQRADMDKLTLSSSVLHTICSLAVEKLS
jgi:hypothetical protein